MSLYKRGKTWWVSFTAPNGQRVRCTSGTEDKTQALEFHDKLKVKYWTIQKLGDKAERTWQEVVVRFIRETNHKASHKSDLAHLRWLDPYLKNKLLSDITRDFVDDITQYRLDEGVSNASVNRLLALLRSIIRKAHYDWEWIDRIPKVRLLPEPKRRIRRITSDEARSLLDLLPEHLSLAARFSLATGLRQGNMKSLKWSQVDLDRSVCWIHPDQAKARRAIHVPLNADAMSVLNALKGKDIKYVFTYRGKPVNQLTTKAWYKALDKAGIKEFRWHDLRHTWASWHVQNGTPLNVLQELGGWESVEMVRRYAHLGQTHLASYSENSCQL